MDKLTTTALEAIARNFLRESDWSDADMETLEIDDAMLDDGDVRIAFTFVRTEWDRGRTYEQLVRIVVDFGDALDPNVLDSETFALSEQYEPDILPSRWMRRAS